MAHVTQNGVLSIQDSVTGAWREIQPISKPTFQVTVTSPLRPDPTSQVDISGPSWQSSTVEAKAMVIYNPATGANTGLVPIDEFATISVKKWHALGRRRGMSHAHWRKVRRERRARR